MAVFDVGPVSPSTAAAAMKWLNPPMMVSPLPVVFVRVTSTVAAPLPSSCTVWISGAATAAFASNGSTSNGPSGPDFVVSSSPSTRASCTVPLAGPPVIWICCAASVTTAGSSTPTTSTTGATRSRSATEVSEPLAVPLGNALLVSTVCSLPSVNSIVTVAPESSRPETDPGPPVVGPPLIVVGSTSTEKPKVSSAPKSSKFAVSS